MSEAHILPTEPNQLVRSRSLVTGRASVLNLDPHVVNCREQMGREGRSPAGCGAAIGSVLGKVATWRLSLRVAMFAFLALAAVFSRILQVSAASLRNAPFDIKGFERNGDVTKVERTCGWRLWQAKWRTLWSAGIHTLKKWFYWRGACCAR